tara:strand:+ start:963 stop:1301 length:339 start_codon:yes stop_codon:yes gene_type:complete
MKNTAKRTTLIVAALIMSLQIFSLDFNNEQEKYIDDNPIDFERVRQEIFIQNTITMKLDIDEEGFINDWRLPDEDYIDDIPMDLLSIEKHAKLQKINAPFHLGDYHTLVRVK